MILIFFIIIYFLRKTRTNLNKISSRSHVIHILHLIKKSTMRSTVFLDLAGTENSNDAGTAGIFV